MIYSPTSELDILWFSEYAYILSHPRRAFGHQPCCTKTRPKDFYSIQLLAFVTPFAPINTGTEGLPDVALNAWLYFNPSFHVPMRKRLIWSQNITKGIYMLILKVLKTVRKESRTSKSGTTYLSYRLIVDSPFFSDDQAVTPSSKAVWASSKLDIPDDGRIRLVYVSINKQGQIWISGLAWALLSFTKSHKGVKDDLDTGIVFYLTHYIDAVEAP